MTRRLPLSLLPLALGTLLLASSPADAQITVCASGCAHTTIQAAVDAASPGGVVEVGDGTYEENVTITKALTLRSVNGRASTTIEGVDGQAAQGAVYVTGATTGLTLGGTGQGFTIVGLDGTPGSERAAIYINGTHQSLAILDNEIVAAGDEGLLAESGASLDGVTIDGNVFSGTAYAGAEPGGCGFTTQFSEANVPRQLVVLGNGGGAVAGTQNNVTFTNNQISGTAGGASTVAGCTTYGQGNSLVTLDVATSTISGNTFSGTTARYGSALRVRRPGTTISGNTFVSTGMGAATSHVFVQNNTTALEAIAAANTFDKGAYAVGGSTLGLAVQGAVAEASAGGTVEVLPGTYVGQVSIDKNLTLQGSGAGSTILQAPASMTSCFSTSSPKFPVVCVQNAVATIDGVTIDGAGHGNGHSQFVGVAFRNAGGTLQNSEVLDIRETPFNGNQHGVGVYSYNDDGVSRTINVWDNEISGFQKNGMALNADAVTPMVIDVRRNTVTGIGLTSVTAQNGIQAYGDLITGTIAENTISGVAYDNTANPTKYVAAGVLNYWSEVDLDDNTFTGAQVGAYWYDGGGVISNNEIGVVPVGNGGQWGIIATDPPSAVPSPFDAPATTAGAVAAGFKAAAPNPIVVEVSGNTVTFSGGDNSGATGIEADSGYGTDDLDVTIGTNTISGFGIGISVYACESGCSTGVFTAVSATGNDLAGNTLGLFTNLAGPLDATANWWGDTDPSDDVEGNVDYSPWLGAAPGTSPMTWYTDDSVQDAIALAASGDVVEVLAGSYSGQIDLDKSLTLNGPQAGVDVAGRTFGDASEATLTGVVVIDAADVTLDGFSVTGPAATYAIFIQRSSADVTITNNRVENVGTTTNNQNVHAVYLNDGPDRVTISDNAFRTIAGNGRTVAAISILDSTGDDCSEDVAITGNDIRDVTSLGAIRYWGSYGIIANHCSVNLLVEDNTIDHIEGEWAHGIGLEGDAQGVAIVRGNTVGDLIRHKADPDAVAVFFENNPSGGSVLVTGNSFEGTMDFGVAQHPGDAGYAYTVNAPNNWWGDTDPSDDVFGAVDYDPWVGKTEAQSVTAANTPTTYTQSGTPTTLNFTTLPPGGGTVSVATYPGLPQGVPAPPGTPIAFSIELTSSMTNHDFEVVVSIDVSGIAGFGPTSRVGYYNSSTSQWVLINGTYAAGPPATYTFTTDHFTPFAFFNTPATAYDIFVVTDPANTTTGAAFPNDTWTAPIADDDWSLNGAPTVDLYVVPEVGSTFFSSSLTIEWDPEVLTYADAVATGGLFDGSGRTFFADEDDVATGSVEIDGSRLDLTNFTTVAGEYIAKLTFSLAAPGHSAVDLTGMRFRTSDGVGGQADVFVTANGGEVKAYLGDVASDGGATTGDGLVNIDDLTPFALAYWSGTGDAAYKVKYDVGPTANNTVFALPTEDGEIEFEDLVIFSISYGLSNTSAYPRRSEPAEAEEASEPVAVTLGTARAVGNTVRVPVLVSDVTDLRALSAEFGLADGFTVVGATRPDGDFLPSDLSVLQMARATPSGAVADAAVFGTAGVSGDGAVLELVLQPTTGLASDHDGADDVARLVAVELRSSSNRVIAVDLPETAEAIPAEFFVAPSYPNPVRGTSTVTYGLPEAAHVEIAVYDAIGRRVMTLVDEDQPAGHHTATLDAAQLPSGLYVYVVRADTYAATQRVTVVR